MKKLSLLFILCMVSMLALAQTLSLNPTPHAIQKVVVSGKRS